MSNAIVKTPMDVLGLCWENLTFEGKYQPLNIVGNHRKQHTVAKRSFLGPLGLHPANARWLPAALR